MIKILKAYLVTIVYIVLEFRLKYKMQFSALDIYFLVTPMMMLYKTILNILSKGY